MWRWWYSCVSLRFDAMYKNNTVGKARIKLPIPAMYTVVVRTRVKKSIMLQFHLSIVC
jgi:hypothetical protein